MKETSFGNRAEGTNETRNDSRTGRNTITHSYPLETICSELCFTDNQSRKREEPNN